jgi:peptidoglycan/LPS O-acetylase OafA/YrhL
VTGRLRELDGLRGIAAAVVVVTHAAYFAHAPGWLFATPVGLALSGFEAVIVFFVLSGFVLALPYAAGRPPEYRTFLVRRFLRLGPAAAVAIVVAALLRGVGVQIAALLAVLSTGLFVTGGHVLTALSTPLWSLVQEFRASIAFPLLVRVSRSRVGCTMVGVGWLAGCVLAGRLGGEAGVSLLVLPAFIAGIRLAHTRRVLLPRATGAQLALTAFVLIALTHAAGRGTWEWAWHRGLTIPVDLLAAVLLILAARRGPRHLLSAPAQYLGRISYSLYLLHFPILYACSEAGLIPLGVLASVLAADVSQRLVEAPAMRYHHEITRTRPLPPLPPVPPIVTWPALPPPPPEPIPPLPPALPIVAVAAPPPPPA